MKMKVLRKEDCEDGSEVLVFDGAFAFWMHDSQGLPLSIQLGQLGATGTFDWPTFIAAGLKAGWKIEKLWKVVREAVFENSGVYSADDSDFAKRFFSYA